MAFNETTRELIKSLPFPKNVLDHGINANDVRINNTLGYAFITDENTNSSLLALNLKDGTVLRRLFNESVVRADDYYVGSYNGSRVYCWNGTQKSYCPSGADGIALASGNFYWGVLASRRFYYISQEVLINAQLSEAEVLAAVQNPGQVGSEQAGFSADNLGRVYILASEQNAIYYIDSLQSQVAMAVNGVAPGPKDSEEVVLAERYVVQTLVRNGMIQHADSAAVMGGYLYFCTNQLQLSPGRQYNNTDKRHGPFRSFRVAIGEGREMAVA